MIEHFYESIEGWFSFRDFYERMVQEAPSPSHFVEVGAWLGRSTAFLAAEIANSGKEIRLDVVDTWQGSRDQPWMIEQARVVDLFGTFWQNMQWGKVSHVIRPIMLESTRAARSYFDGELDFVFIDAGHVYLDISADIQAWMPKVKQGGILAGDDFDPSTDPDVCIAVSELIPGFQIQGRTWFKRIGE